MTTPRTRIEGGLFAHLRVAACDIAVPVSDIVQAIDLPADGLTPLPRRQGALEGVVELDGGMVPVVALDRWVGLGEAGDASEARIVILRAGASRIGIRADALKGVKRIATEAIQTTCHDCDDEELFDAVAPATAERPLLCLLEVARLMALTAIWCDDAGLKPGEGRVVTAESRSPGLRYAVFTVGNRLWALPASSIVALVKTPAAELHWAGQRVCGIAAWNGRKVPLVDLGAGGAGEPARPLMAVVGDGPLAVGIVVSRCERMVSLVDECIVPATGADLLLGTAGVDGLGHVSVVSIAGLFHAVPEATISRSRPSDADRLKPATRASAGSAGSAGSAASAASAIAGESHYLVFEADRAYASPSAGVIGVVALPAEAIDDLRHGRRASVDWRGRKLDVINLPPLDGGKPMSEPRIAVVLEGGADSRGPSAIAVRRLTRWLPAHAAPRSSMRMHSVGEVSVITPPGVQRSASLVVVDLAQMAYMLS